MSPDWAAYFLLLCKQRWRRGVMSLGVLAWMIGGAIPLVMWLLGNPMEPSDAAASLTGGSLIALWSAPIITALTVRRERAAARIPTPGDSCFSPTEILLGLLFGPAWVEWALAAAGLVAASRVGTLVDADAAYLDAAAWGVPIATTAAVYLWLPRPNASRGHTAVALLVLVWAYNLISCGGLVTLATYMPVGAEDFISLNIVSCAIIAAGLVRQILRTLGQRAPTRWELPVLFALPLLIGAAAWFIQSPYVSETLLISMTITSMTSTAFVAGVIIIWQQGLRGEVRVNPTQIYVVCASLAVGLALLILSQWSSASGPVDIQTMLPAGMVAVLGAVGRLLLLMALLRAVVHKFGHSGYTLFLLTLAVLFVTASSLSAGLLAGAVDQPAQRLALSTAEVSWIVHNPANAKGAALWPGAVSFVVGIAAWLGILLLSRSQPRPSSAPVSAWLPEQLSERFATAMPLVFSLARSTFRRRSAAGLAALGLSLLGPLALVASIGWSIAYKGVELSDAASSAFQDMRVIQIFIAATGLVALYTTLSADRESGAFRRNLTSGLTPLGVAVAYMTGPAAVQLLSILVMTALVALLASHAGAAVLPVVYIQLLFLLGCILSYGWAAFYQARPLTMTTRWAPAASFAFVVTILVHGSMALGLEGNQISTANEHTSVILVHQWSGDMALLFPSDQDPDLLLSYASLNLGNGIHWLALICLLAIVGVMSALTWRLRERDRKPMGIAPMVIFPPLAAMLVLHFCGDGALRMRVAASLATAFGAAVWLAYEALGPLGVGTQQDTPGCQRATLRWLTLALALTAVGVVGVLGPGGELDWVIAGTGGLALAAKLAFWVAILGLLRDRAPSFRWAAFGLGYLLVEVLGITSVAWEALGYSLGDYYPLVGARYTLYELVAGLANGSTWAFATISVPSLAASLGSALQWTPHLSEEEATRAVLCVTLLPTLSWGGLAWLLFLLPRRWHASGLATVQGSPAWRPSLLLIGGPVLLAGFVGAFLGAFLQSNELDPIQDAIAREEFGRATELVERALEFHPDSAVLWLEKATVLQKQGVASADVQAALEEATHLAPALPEVWMAYADWAEAEGDDAQLAHALNRLVETAPDEYRSRKRRGEYLEEQGQYEAAHADWEVALAARPESSYAANQLARVLESLHRLEEAEQVFQRAAKNAGKGVEFSRNMVNRAGVLLELERADEARLNCEAALAEPGINDDAKPSTLAYFNRVCGDVYAQLDLNRRARELYVAALEHDPDRWAATSGLRRIEKGYLGIGMLTDRSPWDVCSIYRGLAGVIVKKVYDGTAARRAGLLPGDLISEIGGRPVSTPEILLETVLDFHAGKTVGVKFRRLAQEHVQEVTLAPLRDDLESPQSTDGDTENWGMLLSEMAATNSALYERLKEATTGTNPRIYAIAGQTVAPDSTIPTLVEATDCTLVVLGISGGLELVILPPLRAPDR